MVQKLACYNDCQMFPLRRAFENCGLFRCLAYRMWTFLIFATEYSGIMLSFVSLDTKMLVVSANTSSDDRWKYISIF